METQVENTTANSTVAPTNDNTSTNTTDNTATSSSDATATSSPKPQRNNNRSRGNNRNRNNRNAGPAGEEGSNDDAERPQRERAPVTYTEADLVSAIVNHLCDETKDGEMLPMARVGRVLWAEKKMSARDLDLTLGALIAKHKDVFATQGRGRTVNVGLISSDQMVDSMCEILQKSPNQIANGSVFLEGPNKVFSKDIVELYADSLTDFLKNYPDIFELLADGEVRLINRPNLKQSQPQQQQQRANNRNNNTNNNNANNSNNNSNNNNRNSNQNRNGGNNNNNNNNRSQDAEDLKQRIKHLQGLQLQKLGRDQVEKLRTQVSRALERIEKFLDNNGSENTGNDNNTSTSQNNRRQSTTSSDGGVVGNNNNRNAKSRNTQPRNNRRSSTASNENNSPNPTRTRNPNPNRNRSSRN